jgi:hypothetical protein
MSDQTPTGTGDTTPATPTPPRAAETPRSTTPRSTTPRSTTPRAARPKTRPKAKTSSRAKGGRRATTKPKEAPVSATQTKQTRKIIDDSMQGAEELRAQTLQLGRQLAVFGLDATEKVVHESAVLYVRAVDHLPWPYAHDIAKVQADLAVKATDVVVRQGRQIVGEMK